MFIKNEGIIDRYVRLFLGGLAIIGGFFWLAGAAKIVLLVIGFIFVFTAISGFCALYKVFNITTVSLNKLQHPKVTHLIFIFLFILFMLTGVYYSDFFTKKVFIEDFNKMNNYYKQTLFYTGQDNRVESLNNYEKLVAEYKIFSDKYKLYQPYALRSDVAFTEDLNRVSRIITDLDGAVRSGDLKSAHIDFEQIRPIFQEMFKRNGFSLLAISLVDFHDAMEKILDTSNDKDIAATLFVYEEVSLKLNAVESIVNDDEIKTIRTKLDEIKKLAEEGDFEKLPEKAAELKSSFVKVYLKRG